LYWLTAGLAAEAPLLLVVDDAHWVDEASLRWLVYLARRLEGLAVAVVVATRPGARSGAGSVLELIVRDGLAERLAPSPLGPAAVAVLVRERLGDGASEEFCETCRETTGGNPLLLGSCWG
jgi:predicted ATPase